MADRDGTGGSMNTPAVHGASGEQRSMLVDSPGSGPSHDHALPGWLGNPSVSVKLPELVHADGSPTFTIDPSILPSGGIVAAGDVTYTYRDDAFVLPASLRSVKADLIASRKEGLATRDAAVYRDWLNKGGTGEAPLPVSFLTMLWRA